MDIKAYFKACRELLARRDYTGLQALTPVKPQYFNWVEEIFSGINVQEHGAEQALIWIHQEAERVFTFQEMQDTSNQFLNLLRKHKIRQGNYIYSLLPLVPANWISMLSTIKGGFILMPTATNLSARDLLYRFESLFPEVFITDLANCAKIEDAERQYGQEIKLKICVGGAREGWVSFSELAQESVEAEAARTAADDPVLYFFTSGTTGLPKIVVHTHFTYPYGHLSTASWVGCTQGDVHYNISSPGWAKFAWSSFFAPWNMGATIFANQVDRFDPPQQLRAMEKYGITTFCGSPTVLRMLIQEDLQQYKLRLRTCCAAGEPLNPDVIQRWKDFTGVTIRDGYGQTETTALVGNLDGTEIKPGSMGKPTFMYDVKICDAEGQEVPPLEEGVIYVNTQSGRPNGLFVEYLDDPKRTWAAFKNGWYFTGDKAYKDKEGYIWFVGRNDDVIKASAYRIGPFEVESVLIEHEAVVESAVVASPHKLRGYAVKAFVILKNGVEPSQALAEELFAFSEQQLAKYKVPRIIEFSSSLPKTISGKIRRIELRSNEAQWRLKGISKTHEYLHPKY